MTIKITRKNAISLDNKHKSLTTLKSLPLPLSYENISIAALKYRYMRNYR